MEAALYDMPQGDIEAQAGVFTQALRNAADTVTNGLPATLRFSIPTDAISEPVLRFMQTTLGSEPKTKAAMTYKRDTNVKWAIAIRFEA